MKKKLLLNVVVAVLIALPLSFAQAVEVFQAKTEVRQYNPEKAYNGYTLFYKGLVFLIDMEGNVVHTWPGLTDPKLYENGNIVGSFKEMDWNGNVVWEWSPPADRSNIRPHHDMWKIFNKKINEYTYLGVVSYTPTQEEAVA
ncbi:MAG: hypothetical protein JRI86_14870, partial [Deltaproteobacteria bacterium]|nr:hypothetical protein [Deltaproteobacteria bacterium]